MRTAVVFITYTFDGEIERRYAKLKNEAPEGAAVFLMAAKGAVVPAALAAETREFDFARLRERAAKVIGDRLVPGNVHLAYLDFHAARPDFDEYWFLEYDVAFSGSWRTLFDALGADRSDLVASKLRGRADEPGWFWWTTPVFPGGPDPAAWLRGFFPLCRLSRAGLDALAARVKAGWTGHHEALIPTAVRAAGLSVSDFGGDGAWTPEERRHRFYTSVSTSEGETLIGTMRAGPAHFLPYLFSDALYHPVKLRRVPSLGDLRKAKQRLRLLFRPGVARAWLRTCRGLLSR